MIQHQIHAIVAIVVASAVGSSSYALSDEPTIGNRHFVKVDEIQLAGPGNYDGLAFDGSQWHFSSTLNNFWWNYDSNFSLLGKTTINSISDLRALSYSSQLHQLLAGDFNTGIVRFINADGTVKSQFPTGLQQLEGLDCDNRDSSVWLVRFTGQIEHWSSTGQFLSSFDGLASLPLLYGWSGVAFDPETNHLFAMNDDDDVYEFTTTGSILGKILNDPFPSGNAFVANGLGLSYDPITRLLRATSQVGGLVTYRLVPEPSTAALLVIGSVVALVARRRLANRSNWSGDNPNNG
jgi:hypothetical protein